MFGFMRGNGSDSTYRQVYAECCNAQRQQYGVDSLLFHSYEAIFLYVIALDAEACPRPPAGAVTCCRLRNRKDNWPDFNAEMAQFCSSFALLLASTKLDDDVRDSGSLIARIIRWRFRSRIAASRAYFTGLDPQFEQRINGYIDQHLRLEQDASESIPIDQYVKPTADAFGYVYKLFGQRLSGNQSYEALLQRIGNGVGAALVSHDCAIDYSRDVRLGRFNPLDSQRDTRLAIEFTLRCLSQVGWECSQAFGPDSLGGRVARSVFERVGQRLNTKAGTNPRRARRKLRLLSPHGVLRRGICDCDCMCDGCDSCGGCECCDACFIFPDCCMPGFNNKSDRNTEKIQKEESESTESKLVGMTGHSVGPLNPTGFVIIGEKRVPAKSQGLWIEDGVEVEIVSEERFGVVVRPI